MIDVTEPAKKELKQILDQNTGAPEACLRLRTNDEGKLGLGLDTERPDDEVLEYEGTKLLVMQSGLADQLKDTALDVVDDEEGRRLVLSTAEK
jgi:Fe-S cluster assembly iron-binding protein IscA